MISDWCMGKTLQQTEAVMDTEETALEGTAREQVDVLECFISFHISFFIRFVFGSLVRNEKNFGGALKNFSATGTLCNYDSYLLISVPTFMLLIYYYYYLIRSFLVKSDVERWRQRARNWRTRK